MPENEGVRRVRIVEAALRRYYARERELGLTALKAVQKLWKVGDRVTRQIFMDDGTWDVVGDSCLSDSPLKHGSVMSIDEDDRSDLYRVEWDGGGTGRYFGHGLDREMGKI